jgi:hypothetical protein
MIRRGEIKKGNLGKTKNKRKRVKKAENERTGL